MVKPRKEEIGMEGKTRNGVLNQKLRSIGTPFWLAHNVRLVWMRVPRRIFFFNAVRLVPSLSLGKSI